MGAGAVWEGVHLPLQPETSHQRQAVAATEGVSMHPTGIYSGILS